MPRNTPSASDSHVVTSILAAGALGVLLALASSSANAQTPQYQPQPQPYYQQQPQPYYQQPAPMPYGQLPAKFVPPEPIKGNAFGLGAGYAFDGFGMVGVALGTTFFYAFKAEGGFGGGGFDTTMIIAGSGCIMLGTLSLSSTWSSRHADHKRRGLAPANTSLIASWGFTGVVLGLTAGSIAASAEAWKMSGGNPIPLFTAGVWLAVGAFALELVNIALIQQHNWDRELRASQLRALRPKPVFAPTVYPVPTSRGDIAPALGLVGAF